MTISIDNERITALSPQGRPMGYVLFPGIRPGLVNVTTVSVLPGCPRQAVADALMEALLCHLSRTNRKAALTDPFAQQYVAAHPQWRSVLPDFLHFTTF